MKPIKDIAPTEKDVENVLRLKYRNKKTLGWSPRMRKSFNYFSPAEWYEALVSKLVQPETNWLDVGSGRFLFPSNHNLAQELSGRCRHLVGLDPDKTLLENEFVHEKVNASINDYRTDRRFDLITMNMVAEHIADPVSAVENLSNLTVRGGHVVIFTIFKWSPVPLVTFLTPFSLHHPIKRVLWGTESKDTFPVAYKMNTRSQLKNIFEENSFHEEYFSYLDDCRAFSGFRTTQFCELLLMKVFRGLGLYYPEVCLLGLYKKL